VQDIAEAKGREIERGFMDTKETVSKYWDWRSQTYTNGAYGFQEVEKSVWKRELRPSLSGGGGLNILDVGTGPGFLALILAEMGHKVTGVDISQGMLEKARDNALMMNLNVDFRHADGERLPFEDESFDLLVNRHLLWTLPNPKEAIEEWARVLKPNGNILAIDGAWFDPSLNVRLRRGLSKAVTFIAEGKLPSFYSVFGEYYNPIRRELPLYSDSKPNRICALFEEARLSNVSFKYLLEVQQFQNSHGSFLHKITHKEPTFLVVGRKT
jgi:ubiquinone/menaquinone biosynthesis C-methylase UbiE